MASSVKTSMTSRFYGDKKEKKKKKSEEDPMGSDDFYKQASAEFARDTLAEKQAQEIQPVEDIVVRVDQKSAGKEVSQLALEESEELSSVEEMPAAEDEAVEPTIIDTDATKEASSQIIESTTKDTAVTKDDDFDDFADDFDDFDFVDHYGEDAFDDIAKLLPENTAKSAINCAFVGVGGGGGKMAKAFLDLGYSRTVLINTTHKDQPESVSPEHFLLLDGPDGMGKDIETGKRILSDNATIVEDTLRARLGRTDWLFVCASGGGGTGSSVSVLHETFERYLASVQGQGKVVYIVSSPTSQEMLNPTIKKNASSLIAALRDRPHIVVDNEKQLQLLRGKVGMLGMYPAANKAFSRMLSQILRLASESSSIQTFDTKDLEQCLQVNGRMFLGTCAMRNSKDLDLGLKIFKGCAQRSPCPGPDGRPKTGALLLVANSQIVSDPVASNHMESAISYVGGRSDTLFSGVYVKNSVPGIVALMLLGGIEDSLL
jgi:cell division GTPase FtsZ